MIKLHERDGTRSDPGYQAARELIRRRVPDDVLVRVLGDRTEERVEELVALSGGYPRQIVELLQVLVARADRPISDDTFAGHLGELRGSYRLMVPSNAFEWLAQVAENHFLTLEGTEEQREAADRMLQDNVILRYQNQEHWFDLHPAVRQSPGVAAAIRRLRQREGTA